MLIGIRLSELSRRSKALLAVSIVLLAAGIATLAWPPVNAAWPLAVWLLAVIALGLYWLSFLLDFRSRLTPPQLAMATAFALLPWLLVLALVVAYLLQPVAAPATP